MSIGVVLSGGGAKGAFQAGVLYQLHEKGIRPDFIVGTSVGALNAAGYSHAGIHGVMSTWRGIRSRRDVLKDQWWKIPFNASGRYSMKPLHDLIQTLTMTPPAPTVPEAIACYVNLKNSHSYYVSNREHPLPEFAKGVLASSSIPFYMEPVDGYLADGGIREVAPLSYALSREPSRLIVITCQPTHIGAADPFDESYPKALSLGLRALDIRDHETLMNDIHAASTGPTRIDLYSPEEYLYGTFDFTPKQINRAIELGLQARPYIFP